MNAQEMNQKARETLEKLKPTLDDVKVSGERMKNHPNKLDKEFYLAMQDDFSKYYDDVVEGYIDVAVMLDEGIATLTTLLRIDYQNKHENDTKIKVPGKDILENEAKVDLKEVSEIKTILGGREKVVRNYIATCRSHVNAFTGQQQEDNE